MLPPHGGSRSAVRGGAVRRLAVGAAGTAACAAVAGVGLAWLVLAQPPALARLLARQRVVLVAAQTTSRAVAITLDDGPHETLTPGILDVLRRHGAQATFFLLGSHVARTPSLAAAVADGGHEIGNHGWLDRPAVLLSRTAFRDDLRRTATAIRAATGLEPRYVRPGSGWFRPTHLREVRGGGHQLALGSVAVLDLMLRDVDREVRFVVDRLQPGAVIVLHEGRNDRAGVVPLLDRLLTEMAERGYRAVTLSELLGHRAPSAGRTPSAQDSRSQ